MLVQGQGAAEQIAAAVRGFSALEPGGAVPRPDLVIVARGGGSIEDLWAFNEEIVVRAIAECSIPVISAVGHETDTTLADFAADLRAPTPTAAAERAVPVREDLRGQLAELGQRQRRAVMRPLQLGRERLAARAERLPKPEALLASPTQRLDDLSERLKRGLSQRIVAARTALQHDAARLSAPLLAQRLALAQQQLATLRLAPQLITRQIASGQQRLDGAMRVMASLDPDAVLARGYARVLGADGMTVTSAAVAKNQARLRIKFGDGLLDVVPEQGNPPRPSPKPPRQSDAPQQPKLL